MTSVIPGSYRSHHIILGLAYIARSSDTVQFIPGRVNSSRVPAQECLPVIASVGFQRAIGDPRTILAVDCAAFVQLLGTIKAEHSMKQVFHGDDRRDNSTVMAIGTPFGRDALHERPLE